MLHKFKLRFRRKLRKRQKQVGVMAEQSGDNVERYFMQRLGKLRNVWRFITGWVALVLLLIGCIIAQIQALSGYYQTRQPIPGGIYTEGVLGSFTNANPLYATNEVDKTVSRLIFSGLFKYDNANHLIGDLAKNWAVDDKGTTYTITLRDNLTWQDGTPLIAADVAFTYHVIQNPDAESPLRGSWEGITVTAVNPHTVTFVLPNPLSSFIYGMTNGIIPQHILKDVPMVGMRSVAFNTQSPVGSGPFIWQDIDLKGTSTADAQESIGLAAFKDYWAGAPKLKSFIVHAFADKSSMIEAYKQRELTAMSGLQTVPDSLDASSTFSSSFPLTAATMVFFKTSSSVLKDPAVRQALVAAANPSEVIKALSYPAHPVREPLLDGQLGYDVQYAQKTNQPSAASQSLDAAGWVPGTDGIRTKDGQRLTFVLTIADTPEYGKVAGRLQEEWRAVGVDVVISKQDEVSFRGSLSSHSYDAVLYGISIGADPDVFVYWDSTQADIRSTNRLNLSEYNSAVVDDALDAGRTRTGDALRVIKYKAFLQQWQQDAPALGLYQPRYLYISHTRVYGLKEHNLNESAGRLYSVNDWMIRTARVTNETL